MALDFNSPVWQEWRDVWKSPESSGGRSFEQWLQDHIRDEGDKRAAQILADQLGDGEISAADQPWVQLVTRTLPDQYQTVGGDGQTVPLEQGLLQQALPGLVADAQNDTQRRTIADQLAQQALAGTNAATTILGRTQGGGFDARTYLQQNQDVAKAYQDYAASTPEQQQANMQANGVPAGMTAEQFAQWHYQQFGQREGRRANFTQSPQLQQDFANADSTVAANVAAANQAAQTQLTALAQSAAQMQQNLSGNLAAKAAALQQQIAALYQNLDQLDATQKAALAQQIATQQQDLEQSIATQRQALEQQVAELGTAAGAQAEAQRAALQQELAGLTAAQAPLNAARSAAAQLQATAVNVGLQRTQDQLTADNARAGFVGGSTAQDAALARATIDARQQAAQAVGNADVANATDTRDIGVRGATGQRTIADALSQAQADIAKQKAAGTAALTTAGAVGRQQLGDAGATGLASIRNNTATTRAAIGAQGANTTYGNVTTGADQARSIADALASGQYSLTSQQAKDVQAAQQQGAAAKATYYDNDYNRSLSAALALPQLAGNTAATLTNLDNYATSGLGRTQGLLNWWNTNSGAAPTPGAVATTPSTTGNSISQLGSGLLSAGLNYGAANQWWGLTSPKTPSLTSPASANIGSNPALSGDWHSTGG